MCEQPFAFRVGRLSLLSSWSCRDALVAHGFRVVVLRDRHAELPEDLEHVDAVAAHLFDGDPQRRGQRLGALPARDVDELEWAVRVKTTMEDPVEQAGLRSTTGRMWPSQKARNLSAFSAGIVKWTMVVT